VSEVFSDALVKVIGYGKAAFPKHNDLPLDPLVRHKLEQIFSFADGLEPDWSKLDLASAGEWLKAEVADRFPFLAPEALDALAWSYTFGWK